MTQPTPPDRPAVLLVSQRKGMRERLAQQRVVDADAAGRLDEKGRAGIRVAVLSSDQSFSAADMDRYPNLAFITTLGAGAEHIDADAARRRGIRIATGAGVNAGEVAEVAVALFILSARRMLAADARVRQGLWTHGDVTHTTHSISARKVGIVGMGAIGRSIAKRLEPFGCALAWQGPNPKPDVAHPYHRDLLDLARWADALIIAAPLNRETGNAVNRAVLDALGPQGVVVNVGRGGIVNEDDLIAALKDGRIAAAGLDVFEVEPTPPAKWEGVPNVFLSPHGAAVTFEVFEAIVERAGQRVEAFVGGQV